MSSTRPAQTLAVQYDVDAVDGTTPSEPFSRDPAAPNFVQPIAENLYVLEQ